MKRTILTVAAIVVSLVSFANNTLTGGASNAVIESTTRQSVYNLKYKAEKAGRVNIKITDEAGLVMMTDDIYGKSFIRPYNFANLPFGNYKISISDASGTDELILKHQVTNVTVVHQVEVKNVDANKYELQLIGNKSDNVIVSIYDNRNELVHVDYITQLGSLSKVYDLTRIGAGSYTFEVVASDKVIRKVEVK